MASRTGLARWRHRVHTAGMDDDEQHEQVADAMTLQLRALERGAYTHLSLTGAMATVPQGKQLRRLLALLALWHGGAVDVVLYVGTDTAGWLEIWDEALSAVPARHHRVRFRIDRSTLVGDDGVI
jgi:hypothetical protein